VLKCWRDLVDTCGHQEKVLADAAGMTASYFSKVSSGQQGDLLGMVLRVGMTFPALSRAFIAGLQEIEGTDPVVLAAEQLANAAVRFLKLQSEVQIRMVRANLSDSTIQERKRGVA
jgi:hypothetical protein